MTARCGGVGRTLRRAAARLLLVSLAALAAAACGRTEPEAVRVEAVERFERLGSAGADAVLRVHNGTGHTLKIRRVRLDAFYPVVRSPEPEERDADAFFRGGGGDGGIIRIFSRRPII